MMDINVIIARVNRDAAEACGGPATYRFSETGEEIEINAVLFEGSDGHEDEILCQIPEADIESPQQGDVISFGDDDYIVDGISSDELMWILPVLRRI